MKFKAILMCFCLVGAGHAAAAGLSSFSVVEGCTSAGTNESVGTVSITKVSLPSSKRSSWASAPLPAVVIHGVTYRLAGFNSTSQPGTIEIELSLPSESEASAAISCPNEAVNTAVGQQMAPVLSSSPQI